MTSTPQAGIDNRPPDHLLTAAFALTAADPAAARAALERLRTVIHAELRSHLDPVGTDKMLPSAETGELGFTDGYDRYHLTITVGLGAGVFDKLQTPPELRPADLIAIPWPQLADKPQATAENGDLVLQVCSDSVYVAEHVLRRVVEEIGDVLTPVWTLAGHQRHTSRAGRPSRNEGRALIGFIDGTSNLNPRNQDADRPLVFIDPDAVPQYPQLPVIDPNAPSPYGGPQPPAFPPDLRPAPTSEPAWVREGTYMVVRGSTFDASQWDKRAVADQERVVGRAKVSGQPLDVADDPTVPIAQPGFPGNDPDGNVTPLDSHIRKVNPRGPGDEQRRIFRRGYPLVSGAGEGGLTRGLVFICFGRTISTQFEFITRAWTTNPDFPVRGANKLDRLREIETVLCGGYFFVPPLTNANHPWSFALPA